MSLRLYNNRNKRGLAAYFDFFDGREGTRTHDLTDVNRVLLIPSTSSIKEQTFVHPGRLERPTN
jgi:hypothetical protein